MKKSRISDLKVMKTRNDCEIACDCVNRANVVLHVGHVKKSLPGSTQLPIGRNAATRVHSNPGSSADQFDWEGRKINGNRKKTPRKCPFQGRNLKVTTPEEGRGKEKVETCFVAVPSEVGFFGVQWRSSPHNLDQYRGKIEFSTLLADLRRHLNTIPHLRSLLQVSHDPNPTAIHSPPMKRFQKNCCGLRCWPLGIWVEWGSGFRASRSPLFRKSSFVVG